MAVVARSGAGAKMNVHGGNINIGSKLASCDDASKIYKTVAYKEDPEDGVEYFTIVNVNGSKETFVVDHFSTTDDEAPIYCSAEEKLFVLLRRRKKGT